MIRFRVQYLMIIASGAYAVVDIDVGQHHASIFQGKRIVDIHVAGETQFRIPYLDDRDFRGRHAHDLFHAT